ncbi:MAG: cache domain-containing protein, partial [Gammaproteobacteria bacterium]
MDNERFFLSLRWKFAILFGAVFLLLHSFFSYVSYLDAIDHFALERKNIETTHIKIAKTLTEDSFSVLEQFAELLPLLGDLPVQPGHIKDHPFNNLDENWARWQLSWDMESIVFFDRNGARVKTWGMPSIPFDSTVEQVLREETPAYRLLCSGNCYIQVVIPVIGRSEVIGAFSVIRTFADVIIKYKRETNSDIGLLVAEQPKAAGHQHSSWPYKLSGLTLYEKNMPLYQYVSNKYSSQEILSQSRRVYLNGSIFEVRLIPIYQNSENNPPYFLLIDDITKAVRDLNEELKQVWFHGVISLTASLIILILVIHLSL